MDPRPDSNTPDATQDPEDEAQPVGFWKRMFGGQEDDQQAASEQPTRPRDEPRNKPRKRTRSIFDKAEQQQKRRYAKASMARRDRLASAIGERVEEVIQDRMVTGEERLARVGESFQEMNVLLGAIGRNLDAQGGRAQHMADTLDALPVAAEKERVVLEAIAEKLEGQAISMQSVPEVVSLVRHGGKVAEQRLVALRGLKNEMELQREQTGAVLEVLRKSSQRFEERMVALEETLAKGRIEARSDATSLKQAIERTTEQLQQESQREGQRSARLLENLGDVSVKLMEGNSQATANAQAHARSVIAYQEAHEEMVDILVQAQHRTVGEMHRLQEQACEREETLAQRTRMTLVGAAGFLGILATAFISLQSPRQAVQPIYVPVRTATSAPAPSKAKPAEKTEAPPRPAKTLPAGMPREASAGER